MSQPPANDFEKAAAEQPGESLVAEFLDFLAPQQEVVAPADRGRSCCCSAC